MAVSRFAAVADAVMATLYAVADTSLAGVDIVDGPPIVTSYSSDFLFIGWTGDPDNDLSGTIRSSYHDTGPTATRDEVVEISGAVISGRGDDNMAAARLRAVTIFGVMESAFRANYGLGLADVMRVELSDGAVRQVRDGLGLAVEIDFTITVTSLI